MSSMQQSTSGANQQGKEHVAGTQHDMTELAQAHQGSTREESIPAPSDMAGTEIWTATEDDMVAAPPSLPVGPEPRPDRFLDATEENDPPASSPERVHPRQ